MRKEITGKQESVTRLNEKVAKTLRSVAAFKFPKLNESMELLRSERSGTSLGKTSNYWL